MNQIRNFFSFKTVYSENKTFLVFSIGRKEDINYSQVQMLENDMYREYLLPFQCTKTASTNKIGFDVSGLTSLSEYLKTELTQAQYFDIISGIQKIISFCQKYYLSCGNLVCDPKYMYYHNTMKKILMIYIPLKNPNYINDSIPGCLKKIHSTARRIIITDGNYMNRYEAYLQRYTAAGKKKGASFSPDSLLHFFNENDPSAVSNDPPVHPETASDQPGRFSIHNQLIPELPEDTPMPVPQPQKDDPPQSYSATIVRSRRDKVYLEDQYGQRNDICKFPFYIGRKPENDLVINQNTVSGKHAVITEIDGRYFIKDTSSNGTYLNHPDNSISYSEIKSGDKLYFDSFCCTFSVTKADSDDGGSSGTVMVSRRRQPEHQPDITPPEQETPASSAESQPDAAPLPVGQPENVSMKALAYLRRADDRLIRIMEYPFTDQEVPGIRIFTEYLGNRMGIFVENTGCNSLVFENTLVARDTRTEIFSGCTLFVDCVKYTFIIEN